MDSIRTTLRRRLAVLALTAVACASLPMAMSTGALAATEESPVTVVAESAKKLLAYRSEWVPGFNLKGNSVAPIVVAVAMTKAPAGTTFTIKRPGRAELNFGYATFSKVESVVFTSDVSNATKALKSLTINAAGPGKVTIKVSVTVDERGYAYDPIQSRYYQYVEDAGISWTDALADAATKTLRGVKGHLATPTTEAENNFLSRNIEGATNVWIAATDRDNEGEFKWAAGAEKGKTFWKARCAAKSAGSIDSCTGANNVVTTATQDKGVYLPGVADKPLVNTFSNWDKDEPNNWGGAKTPENYVATNWQGGFGLWNDLPENTGSISGYIVEFPNTPGKPFVGVSVASQTYLVGQEKSPYRPVSVASRQMNRGYYVVTWANPKVLSTPIVKNVAKKLITGFAVTNDVNSDACFQELNAKRECVFEGFPNGVKPVFTVLTVTSKSVTKSNVGQRTFGSGVIGTRSRALDFVTFSPMDSSAIPNNAKIKVFVRGLTDPTLGLVNAVSWTLTNIVDNEVLATGPIKDGAGSGSINMPRYTDDSGLQQINLKFVLNTSSGGTFTIYYTLFTTGRVVIFRTGSPNVTAVRREIQPDRSWKFVEIPVRKIPNWLVQ